MLGGQLVYIREWINTAIEESRSSTANLSSMKISDPRDKHVVYRSTDKHVIDKAKSKRSLFFPRFYPSLPRLFWYLMRSYWHDVLTGQHIYRVVDCGFAIGAAEHKETSYVVFDIQPPNSHAYPILEADLTRYPEYELLSDPDAIFGKRKFQNP